MAQLDLKTRVLYRTFPGAFSVQAKAGYSIPIYKMDDEVMFGYIRPELALQSSGVVNTAMAKIDFNPISFVNFYVGKSITNRDYEEFDTFDCSTLICTSKVDRTIYGARMVAKHGSFFYLIGLKYFSNKLEDSLSGDYVDEIATLVHTGRKSILRQSEHIFGYNVNEDLTLGYLGVLSKMRNNDQESAMHLLFGNYKFKPKWDATVGAGIFNTRFDANVGTIFTMVSWTPEKGLPLF